MSFAIAAAGTGGHVYPGLAVGEALVDEGIDRSEILYIGGDRLEAKVYPEAGFPFLALELRGLTRGFAVENLKLPGLVMRAMGTARSEIEARRVRAVLGLGNYITVPVGLAARRAGVPLSVAEQNAEAGLANRLVSLFAQRSFSSFPHTAGLHRQEWVGNPIRRTLAEFDRSRLRPGALNRWGFDPETPVLGVFGGSLGAGVVNEAVASMLEGWEGPPLQVLHLAGHGAEETNGRARVSPHRWVVLDFCHEMDSFFAACDLVVSRSGGSVAELTATATPAVLIPGEFGSGHHQEANAAALEEAGCAVVVGESHVDRLGPVVRDLLGDPSRLGRMAEAAGVLARPRAATTIARALMEMAS